MGEVALVDTFLQIFNIFLLGLIVFFLYRIYKFTKK